MIGRNDAVFLVGAIPEGEAVRFLYIEAHSDGVVLEAQGYGLVGQALNLQTTHRLVERLPNSLITRHDNLDSELVQPLLDFAHTEGGNICRNLFEIHEPVRVMGGDFRITVLGSKYAVARCPSPDKLPYMRRREAQHAHFVAR